MDMMLKTKLSALGLILMVASTVFLGVIYVEAVKGQPEPLRVACVGDSITEGSDYPVELRLLLGHNYSVANFGLKGSTVSLTSDKPYMHQSQFQNARNYNPDIVVIMLGTNDAHPKVQGNNEYFKEDYSRLIYAFRSLNSDPLIWVVKPPPIQNNDLELNSTFFSNKVVSEIEQTANNLNLPTIDVYSAFGNNSGYLADGVHPSAVGSQVIASAVYDAITSSDEANLIDNYFG